jgi:hypothetical protein
MMTFTVDGVTREFDEEKLTFGEGRAIEKVTGFAFGEISEHASSGRLAVIQAFIWVALKRDEPTLTFSDLDDRNISDFVFEDAKGDDADPTTPTGGGTGSTSAASTTSVTSPTTSESVLGSGSTSPSERSTVSAST